MTGLSENARDLGAELDWLSRIVEARFANYFGQDQEATDIDRIAPPKLKPKGSAYAQLLTSMGLDRLERLAVVLALAPHIRPHALDPFHTRNKTVDRRFTEFGCVLRGEQLVPTGETLAWLHGGDDLQRRFQVQELLDPTHRLVSSGLLNLSADWPGQPVLQLSLTLAVDSISELTTGAPYRPAFGSSFPARRIEASANWKDLILHPKTLDQLQEIRDWIANHERLPELGMKDLQSRGLRALFHGPPGTGKTLAASLLGKWAGRDVYRIDLSMVVSKYIGETEKNLASVFDRADHKGWILFFDEADALFGKRVDTKDSNDRYANQEVSYLLQRIESFGGVVILASNLKNNIDEAFARRFQVVVHFPIPSAKERIKLWRTAIPAKAALDKDVDLQALAETYKVSGAAIVNAVRYAVLRSLSQDQRPIANADLVTGVRRELAKEGKAA